VTIAAVSLGALAAVAAWILARREPGNVGIAVLLTCFAVGDLVQLWTNEVLAGSSRPYTGGAEAALHFGHLFLFGREFALLVAVLVYFRGGRGVWGASVAGVASFIPTLDYPRVSGANLRLWYIAVLVGTQEAIWLLGIRNVFRHKPTTARLVLLFWCASTFALTADMTFIADWGIAAASAIVCSIAVLLTIAARLWRLARGDMWARS